MSVGKIPYMSCSNKHCPDRRDFNEGEIAVYDTKATLPDLYREAATNGWTIYLKSGKTYVKFNPDSPLLFTPTPADLHFCPCHICREITPDVFFKRSIEIKQSTVLRDRRDKSVIFLTSIVEDRKKKIVTLHYRKVIGAEGGILTLEEGIRSEKFHAIDWRESFSRYTDNMKYRMQKVDRLIPLE